MIGIEILLGLIIVTGFVALEVKKLRTSVISLAAAGFFFIIASFVFGSLEVGVGGIIAFSILIPLLFWALKQTTGEDITIRIRPEPNDIFILISMAVFVIVCFLVVFPRLGIAELGPPPAPIEGPAGLSILREVLVLLAAAAGIWAVIRKVGRREK